MKKFFYFILPLLLFISCSHDFSFGNKCTINYQSEYGNCPKQIKVYKGTVLQSEHLPELYEYGHIFTGWYIDDVKIEPNEFTITKNIILKAGWNYGYEVTSKEFYELAPTLKNLRESILGQLTVYITITDENPDLELIRDALISISPRYHYRNQFIYLDLSRCIEMTTVPRGVFTGQITNWFLGSPNGFDYFQIDFKDTYGFDYTDDYIDIWDYNRYKRSAYMYNHCAISHLILPNTIKKIETQAFSSFVVTYLYLPDSIEIFEDEAFICFSSEEPIKLPSSMQEIPKGTFAICSSDSPQEIIWPTNILSIGPFAFFNKYCFHDNRSIEFSLPDTIVTIKNNAFDENDFCSYNLPKSLKRIEKNAFATNRLLKEQVFPASINYIGEKAYTKCSELSKLSFEQGLSDLTIDIGAFSKCPKLELIDFSQVFNDSEAWDLIIISSADKELKTFNNINVAIKQYDYNLIQFLKKQSENYSIIENENIKFHFEKK